VKALKYRRKLQTLDVTLEGERKYHYLYVPEQEYRGFLAAKSKAAYLKHVELLYLMQQIEKVIPRIMRVS